MVVYTTSRGVDFYWNMSSVFVNIGFALGASPGSHSETPRRGWALLHCFCMKTTSLWLSMNESTTCATFGRSSATLDEPRFRPTLLRHDRRLVQLRRTFPILCDVLVRVDIPENRRLHFELLYVDGRYRPLQVGLASEMAPG